MHVCFLSLELCHPLFIFFFDHMCCDSWLCRSAAAVFVILSSASWTEGACLSLSLSLSLWVCVCFAPLGGTRILFHFSADDDAVIHKTFFLEMLPTNVSSMKQETRTRVQTRVGLAIDLFPASCSFSMFLWTASPDSRKWQWFLVFFLKFCALLWTSIPVKCGYDPALFNCSVFLVFLRIQEKYPCVNCVRHSKHKLSTMNASNWEQSSWTKTGLRVQFRANFQKGPESITKVHVRSLHSNVSLVIWRGRQGERDKPREKELLQALWKRTAHCHEWEKQLWSAGMWVIIPVDLDLEWWICYFDFTVTRIYCANKPDCADSFLSSFASVQWAGTKSLRVIPYSCARRAFIGFPNPRLCDVSKWHALISRKKHRGSGIKWSFWP